jgi:hypothetical protein
MEDPSMYPKITRFETARTLLGTRILLLFFLVLKRERRR